ncbi:MAG TPA: response regulator, partial [Roseiflexaceae bacterium]|nr:response regulator [Roseiflexaceae bacterium]
MHGMSLQSAVQNPKPKILLADDNADMREYVRRLLNPMYDVVAVGDGTEALQVARNMQIDLVLSDVMMPGLDGFGLLGALRADAQLRTIPVIMVSARAGEEARVEGVEAGADDYLIKPFSARELLARVKTNLELARVRQHGADALRASQASLALALQAGKAGTFEWDIQDDVNRWSPELESLYDVPPGTFEGNYGAWASRVEPEDEQAVRTGLQAALEAHERDYIYEFRAILPGGKRRWLAGRARFDYLANGTPLRMIGINVDIHERKQAELNAQFLLDLDTQVNHLAEAAEIEQAAVDSLGAYLNLARSCFGHIDGDRVSITHEWSRDERS